MRLVRLHYYYYYYYYCFAAGTVAEGAPVIPISAQLKYNLDAVCEYITTKITVPPRDFTSQARLIVIRSFDVNKPGCEVDDLKGGVAGGSILMGVLRVSAQTERRSEGAGVLWFKHILFR